MPTTFLAHASHRRRGTRQVSDALGGVPSLPNASPIIYPIGSPSDSPTDIVPSLTPSRWAVPSEVPYRMKYQHRREEEHCCLPMYMKFRFTFMRYCMETIDMMRTSLCHAGDTMVILARQFI